MHCNNFQFVVCVLFMHVILPHEINHFPNLVLKEINFFSIFVITRPSNYVSLHDAIHFYYFFSSDIFTITSIDVVCLFGFFLNSIPVSFYTEMTVNVYVVSLLVNRVNMIWSAFAREAKANYFN